jgi:hypothetical protein
MCHTPHSQLARGFSLDSMFKKPISMIFFGVPVRSRIKLLHPPPGTMIRLEKSFQFSKSQLQISEGRKWARQISEGKEET